MKHQQNGTKDMQVCFRGQCVLLGTTWLHISESAVPRFCRHQVWGHINHYFPEHPGTAVASRKQVGGSGGSGCWTGREPSF